MRIALILEFIYLTGLFSGIALADNILLGAANTPVKYDLEAFSPAAGMELTITGNNPDDKPVTLVVRVDNQDSKSYFTRVNEEFTLQPGTFSVQLPLSRMKMSGGNFLEPPYTHLHIFTANTKYALALESVAIKEPAPIPKDTLAIDLGPTGSPVFPGFELLSPDSPNISGDLKAWLRPSGDALIKDGIDGINTIQIDWPNGDYLLSLWMQEQGEWEYLPHPLTRKITVNGRTVVDDNLTPQDWVKQVWFAGISKEGGIDGDLWETTGKRRDGFIQVPVTISSGKLDIHFEGERSGRFLSALILELPANQYAAGIQAERRKRFLAKWPVEIPEFPEKETSLQDISTRPFQLADNSRIYPAARNTRINLVFEVQSETDDNQPVIALATPKNSQGERLLSDIRYGFWRFERPEPNATRLILDDSYLRTDINSIRLSKNYPRRLYLQVDIPEEAEPGIYQGNLQVMSHGTLMQQPFTIQVMPVTLPKLQYASGLYLEPAPWYTWFPSLKDKQTTATQCDLSFMQSLGFTAVAPGLSTPSTPSSRDAFIRELQQVVNSGFDQPVLAYAPLKRLIHGRSEAEVADALATLKEQLAEKELPAPYWSLFDEPRGEEKLQQIRNLAKLLRPEPLELKMAGHLNHKEHRQLLPTVDLAIANHAYGISRKEISEANRKRLFWMYNMPWPRLAGGFFLWRSGADGYIQWHARMPTADPFDPTDGREGDVIYIYPWNGTSCPQAIDIHKKLLALHESTLDLRWLQWLDQIAEKSTAARRLRVDIEEQVPTRWSAATRRLNTEQLVKLRQKIISFATTLKPEPAGITVP